MASAPNMQDLVTKATFISRGTIQRLNASLVSAVPANAATAVVKVDEVLRAPQVLGSLNNSQVTVQLTAPASAAVGQQWVFFTVPIVYSDTIAVQEIGQLQSAPPTPAL